jgi:F-type H+-transporting ATPase subunit epsilon
MHCQLRSAERALFDGEATMVVTRSPKGEFAVMEGHAPLLAVLDNAPLRIKTEKGEHAFALLEGLLRVSKEGVMILAQEAIPSEEIDLSAVQKRRAEIEQELPSTKEKDELLRELAALRMKEWVKERHE